MSDTDDAGDVSADASSVLTREKAQREAASQAALGRYRRRVNRQRAIYYPVVAAVVIALVVVFAVAYLHGEAHNTRLVTVSNAPATVRLTTPTPSQSQAWRTSDRAAVGQPVYGGTVVVYDAHTMRGLDARTGKQTWSYYRSNRTVCSAFQVNGIAVAVYELAGNCDELTGLDAGTGARQWTRTLDFNGLPVHGRPTFQLDVAESTLLVTTPAEIYSIGIGSGEQGGGNHFTYSRFGCRINGAVVGAVGALISQTCTNPRCGSGSSKLRFCGRGPQLLLRPTSDPSGDPPTRNPNRIEWNDLGNTDVPISADDAVTAGNTGTGDLDVLAADDGSASGSVTLGVDSGWQDATSLPLDSDGQLVWAGGKTSLVRTSAARPVWQVASLGPPTVSTDNQVVVPQTGTVHLLARASGRVQSSYQISPSPQPGSRAYRLGAGFLIASTSGTTAYA